MGHVKQKKSANSSTSTPPETLGIEVVSSKDIAPLRSVLREPHTRPAYPEQLNVEELISQINRRNTSSNEITNDSNNNSNSNNNTIHRTDIQLCSSASTEDIEKGPVRRHHHEKPLYRRLITFIRNLWIGAKFNVGKDGKQSR